MPTVRFMKLETPQWRPWWRNFGFPRLLNLAPGYRHCVLLAKSAHFGLEHGLQEEAAYVIT